MNKMLTFLTAPVTALFYPPVYRDAAKSSAGRGVLYSLYLAVLMAALVTMLFSVKVMPLADAFAGWVKTNMPVLIWTPAGLSLENGQTTATLKHPQYGTIALFDMTKPSATAADMGDAYLLVTSQKVYIKRAPGQMEERDITGAGMSSGQQLPPRVRIDGGITATLYQNIKRVMAFVLPFSVLVSSFVFSLMMNLFFSLAGLFLNRTRKEKLGYGAIFNLTCFATTALFTINWVKILVLLASPQARFSWPFFVNIVITLGYLYFAVKVTDSKPEAV